ncbi:Uncharacterised protein [Orientia tsutsugamushi str. Gilliam]|uniref:Uncharacterized protein n=2 Tax=Orientia tsutsugamushi TaxID=784 RepID=A0A2U3R149_ORITS|nr:Uncharacterised protein [Orientia tsutsugamushi str. Gilliam]
MLKDYDTSSINYGMLELDQQKELEQLTHQEQFTTWMKIKGISLVEDSRNHVITSNIVQNILNTITNRGNQALCEYDRCFEKVGFEKDTGYDKSTFDKWCI